LAQGCQWIPAYLKGHHQLIFDRLRRVNIRMTSVLWIHAASDALPD
jgi:hypothetical protein